MGTQRLKVFIIGISGFLGHKIAYSLREKFLISGAYFRHPVEIPEAQTFPVSFKSLEIIENLIRTQAPDVLINAMGIKDIKFILKQEKLSENLNVGLAVTFAGIANKIKAKFIQLSCADVYDGSEGNYSEDTTDFTISDIYGKQKITAESYIRTQTLESTTLRLGKVIGIGHPFNPSHFDSIRRACSIQQMISASKQKKFSYLSAHSFISAIDQVLSHPIPVKHRTFNIGGCNMTELDFLSEWTNLMGLGKKLIQENHEPEKRDLSLSCQQFQAAYPDWKAESKDELFLHVLKELTPGSGIKKWQKILQIP